MPIVALLLVLTGCDVVFSTPFEDDDLIDAAPGDDTGDIDAIDGDVPDPKCTRAPEERLCITFDADPNTEQALDGSSFENHATVVNVARIERTANEPAVAVGTASEIVIRADTGLELGGPLTYAMWIWSSSAQLGGATAFDNHVQFGIVADVSGAQAARCTFVHDTTLSPLSTSAPISEEMWVHVACVKDAQGLRIYLNGALSNANTTNDAKGPVNTGNPEPVRIGQDSQDGGLAVNRWNGQLDDVFVYSYALTEAQVFALANR